MHPWDLERRRLMTGAAACAALLIGLLAWSAYAAPTTTEVLVLSTATAVPTTAAGDRRSIEIQNQGPNPIYCAMTSATAVSAKARKIDTGGSWGLDLSSGTTVYCITTVDQVTGAATVVTETK
jgi:hypothetical protein